MTPPRTALALRSRAALEEQAGYAAWMNGHRRIAIRYFIRSARHTVAARRLAKADDRG